ncbi:PTS system mannose/fructose/N-acetylgalactosamine-transporter subunit IIB [Enterococcus sp. AZ109]|uniref:PTS system mannose/fructose/N-acetylgalactosamine-transporter subunit IIB n=1 Tax=Enterococcus sp. AZ109 TaxID=2774634 RepID=UPI003F284AFE
MAIVWTRLDDRLIHGQVASSWLSHVKAEQAIVVDDDAANNEVQRKVLQVAAPAIKVHVFSTDKFIDIYKNKPIKRRTILIIGNTETALKLVKNGVNIDYLNFGGMRGKAGRKEYRYDLCFTEKEMVALEEVLALGTTVDYQMAAYDTPEPLMSVLEKIK